MTILKGVRPLDHVLTAVMVALAVFISVEDVAVERDAYVAHRLDSHSAWIVPVLVLAALPILWRRRHLLAAIGASVVVLAASVLAFGWITRCGFALPLSFAFAYAVARFAGTRREHLLGLAGVVLLQVVTLVEDASTGGLGALPYALPIAAASYGAGYLVRFLLRSRTAEQAGGPTVNLERVHA